MARDPPPFPSPRHDVGANKEQTLYGGEVSMYAGHHELKILGGMLNNTQEWILTAKVKR